MNEALYHTPRRLHRFLVESFFPYGCKLVWKEFAAAPFSQWTRFFIFELAVSNERKELDKIKSSVAFKIELVVLKHIFRVF